MSFEDWSINTGWYSLVSIAILFLCALISVRSRGGFLCTSSSRRSVRPIRVLLSGKLTAAAKSLLVRISKPFRHPPVPSPTSYVHLTRLLAREVLLGKSLSHAVRSLPQHLLNDSPYLRVLNDQISSGASFDEALQIGAREVKGVLDRFYELIFTSSKSSAEELSKSLELALRFSQFLQQHLSREKSRTVQARLQFFLISCIVPVLFLANLFLFPEILWNALKQPVAGSLLLFSFVLYFTGILLFRKMSLSAGTLLLMPRVQQSKSKVQSQRALECLRLSRATPLNDLSQEIQNLIFLAGLEIALRMGKGVRSAISSASNLAAESVLADFAERVLRMQARGALLKESFLDLESEFKNGHMHTRVRWGRDRGIETFFGIGRACHDLNLLVGFVSSSVDEAKNTLKDLSEECTGVLTVKLLFPLCFCHMPSAFLMLLAPVLTVLAQAGF